MSRLLPQQQVPGLRVNTVNGGVWDLSEQSPDHFTFVFFYRGLHCPLCAAQLKDLNKHLDELTHMGLSVVAISCDTLERAETSKKRWGLDKLTVGYNLGIEQARTWDLYVSKAIKDEEPDQFSEPALYIVRPNGELYATAMQSMPFTRPGVRELIQAFQYIIPHGYPGRGEA